MEYTTHIQYKGTDLCMDWACPICKLENDFNHIDGYNVHYVVCPVCKAVFEMPTDVPLKQVPPNEVTEQMLLWAQSYENEEQQEEAKEDE